MISSDQQQYLIYAGVGCAVLAAYITAWRVNARRANIVVILLALAMMAYLVDWNYFLNTYFRVNWKLPS